jgi:LCP family protein required for cell wall assembly
LKTQFVNINALQGKGKQPEQPSNGWSAAGTHPAVPLDQPQGGQVSSVHLTQSPGEELQSNWKADSLPPAYPMNGNPVQVSLTEQDTVKQQTMYNGSRPITGPTSYANTAQAHMLAVGQMPPSPYQSGITPFAEMQVGSQSLQPPQLPSMQYPEIQQFPPVNGASPLSQPLVAPMNIPANTQMPQLPMPMSYQEAGGYAPQPPYKGKQGKTGKKRRFPIWARIVVSIFLLALVVVGGFAGYYYYNLSAPVSHIVGQQVTRLHGDEDPNANRNGVDILSGPRINILLLGSDTDQKFSNGSYLAQSDIVVTIDPASKTVGMLSIPRDFWISVPGSGMHKLDEAYGLGGVALSRLTIYQDFGIPINYYAWVGLDGFIKVINTVGGVDVDVLHPITDDNYPDDVGNHTGDLYAYKRLYIPPGPQHLSGPEALEYVRSRHADLVGDFGRSARQQQVLSALKTKLNNPDIVGKMPAIAHDLDGYVKTDMQLTDVFKLMNFARGLNPAVIKRVILGPPYSQIGSTPSGESVVYPDCAKIVPVIAQMFALGNKAACNIQANSNTDSVTSASKPSSTTNSSVMNTSSQTANQLSTPDAMGLIGSSDNLLGLHGLLDLISMVVFESPQVIQA